ncbi:hypothetical protein BH18ACT8_BH18ACT8_02770 [soil metagenome]
MSGLVTLAAVSMVTGLAGSVGSSPVVEPVTPAPFVATPSRTEQRVAALTVRELVHQLVVIPVAGRAAHHVSPGAAAFNLAAFGVRTPARVVATFRPGGVIYFGDNVRSVGQVRRLSNGLQQAARRTGQPLLIMTDQEGGRVSRMPGPVTGSQPAARDYAGNVRRARRDARDVGRAMQSMGVDVDLAPVADVNTVGDAGVIGDRSFGSSGRLVGRMVRAQVCGYHAGGVATALKHWPGHGSTRVDSHASLPTLRLAVETWRREHVRPFRAGIRTGTDMVMAGHLAYPKLDPNGRPATLSRRLNQGWLRDVLGFRGVIITDSLSMGALVDRGSSGHIAVRAFRAGSDLLLMPASPRAAVAGLRDAVREGVVTRADIERSVTRIMHLKDKLGLIRGWASLRGC